MSHDVSVIGGVDRRRHRGRRKSYPIAPAQPHRAQIALELGAGELCGVIVKAPSDAQRYDVEASPRLSVQLAERFDVYF